MRRPFDGTFRLTQAFNDECCRASYAKFGMKGHNGLDFACPTGTKILAPHDGKVIESTLDPKGYGIYVKIENSIEGSVLAHFREARVGVGDGVKEGDLIGYSDNSGNSTGAHLHWGYYRFPRDRQNGFAGYIDQTPFIGLPPQLPKDTIPVEKERMRKLEEVERIFNAIRAIFDIQDNEIIIMERMKMLSSVEDLLRIEQKKNETAFQDITKLKQDVADKNIQYENLKTKIEKVLKEVNIAIDDNTGVLGALDELEKQVIKPVAIEKPWYIQILEFFRK